MASEPEVWWIGAVVAVTFGMLGSWDVGGGVCIVDGVSFQNAVGNLI